MVPRGGLPQANKISDLDDGGSIGVSTQSLCFSERVTHQAGAPPPRNETAASVGCRGSGRKHDTRKVDTKAYIPIGLLDKWLLQQAIFRDRNLSPTAKVVAGVLLDCLNCKTGKCCPSLAHLAARIGKKRRVISAAITELRQRGWLTHRRRRGPSDYGFAFDRLQQHDVQETAPHDSEGVQKAACLDVRDTAYEDAQKTAHLNTENVESGNRNQEVIPPGTDRTRPAKSNQKQPKPRRARLAEDWQPSETNIAFAVQCGLREEAISREAIKFKNYYIGKGVLMVDWDRAWQNWCIRAIEYAGAQRTTNAASRRSLVAGLWGQS